MDEIIVGDNGTILEGIVNDEEGVVDVRGADVLFIIKSATTRIEKNGIVTDGLNGVIQCTLDSDDVKEIGSYSFQANIKFIDGKSFSTDIQKFKVGRKL